MRRLLLLAVALLGLATAGGQNLVLHAGGGLTSHYGGATRNIGAFKLGAGLEFELSQKVTIEPALLFFAKGWKDKDKTVLLYDEEGHVMLDEEGHERTGKMNVTTNTNYIVLPVTVNYFIRLASPHYIMLSAGPYAAVGVGGNRKTKGDTSRRGVERIEYQESAFSADGMHRFDAGLTAGVGYEFNHLIDAGVEADFGLLNVKRGGGKNVTLLLSLAYRFRL